MPVGISGQIGKYVSSIINRVHEIPYVHLFTHVKIMYSIVCATDDTNGAIFAIDNDGTPPLCHSRRCVVPSATMAHTAIGPHGTTQCAIGTHGIM